MTFETNDPNVNCHNYIYIINSRTKHATTLLSQKRYEKAEPEDIITDPWEVTNLNKKMLFGDSN